RSLGADAAAIVSNTYEPGESCVMRQSSADSVRAPLPPPLPQFREEAILAQYPALHMIFTVEKVSGACRRTVDVLNPVTRETIGALPLAEAADLDRALEVAENGFKIWRKSTPQERAAVLTGAARLMVERQEELARAATMEEGKPLPESRIEVMMNVGLFNFYAGECFRLYGRELVRPEGMRSTVRYEPVGPVAAFAPWNFPL